MVASLSLFAKQVDNPCTCTCPVPQHSGISHCWWHRRTQRQVRVENREGWECKGNEQREGERKQGSGGESRKGGTEKGWTCITWSRCIPLNHADMLVSTLTPKGLALSFFLSFFPSGLNPMSPNPPPGTLTSYLSAIATTTTSAPALSSRLRYVTFNQITRLPSTTAGLGETDGHVQCKVHCASRKPCILGKLQHHFAPGWVAPDSLLSAYPGMCPPPTGHCQCSTLPEPDRHFAALPCGRSGALLQVAGTNGGRTEDGLGSDLWGVGGTARTKAYSTVMYTENKCGPCRGRS